MLEQRKQQEELLLIKYEQVTAKLIAGDGKVYNAEIFDDSMPYRYCVSAPKGEYNFVVEAETDEGNHVTITSLLALDTNMEKDINDIVKVVFTVDAKTESTADGAGEIKSTAAGKTLQYLDFKLTLTVNDEPPTDIGDTNKQLLKIIVPFARGDKQNITVYRYHNGSIDTLTESRNEDGEGIDVGEDSITIYAMKFSTYGIGYVQP